MKIEEVTTTGKNVKFTITPDRITIKYPLNFSDDKTSLLDFAKRIHSEIKPEQSWRGKFLNNKYDKIILSTDCGKQKLIFEM